MGFYANVYTGDLLCYVFDDFQYDLFKVESVRDGTNNGPNIMLLKSQFCSSLKMTGELEQF